jgi:hypothetical protein
MRDMTQEAGQEARSAAVLSRAPEEQPILSETLS